MLFSEKDNEKQKIIHDDSTKIDDSQNTAFGFTDIFKHEYQCIRSENTKNHINDCLRNIEIPFEFLFFKDKFT